LIRAVHCVPPVLHTVRPSRCQGGWGRSINANPDAHWERAIAEPTVTTGVGGNIGTNLGESVLIWANLRPTKSARNLIKTSPSDWLRLVYLPKGTPERIRTSDRRIRNPLLYPTELRGQAYFLGSLWRKPSAVTALTPVLAMTDVSQLPRLLRAKMSATADSTAKATPSKRYQDFHSIHIQQNTERKEQRKISLLRKAGQLSEPRLALAV
jgi:hypothetical protein